MSLFIILPFQHNKSLWLASHEVQSSLNEKVSLIFCSDIQVHLGALTSICGGWGHSPPFVGGGGTHFQCIYYLMPYPDLGSQGYFGFNP